MNLQCLEMGLDDVRFVGIWGMGGLGKTTLARAVYDRFSTQFDACGFLVNVRDTSEKYGHARLQQQLIEQLNSSDKIWDTDQGKKIIKKLCVKKKILLVLDDVNHINQLEDLAESVEWFGDGSRVIITTRDIHLLKSHDVHKVYKIKVMEKDESLQLFSRKAFKKDFPEKGYLELSESVVQYSGGLPLALKTLGSFLCGRRIPEWRNALNRLKQIPNDDIHQILRISYDDLNKEEKTIFLDVACFFIGWEKDLVTQLLESCGMYATIGLSILIEKSLLTVSDRDMFGRFHLEMHDLVQELGRGIACEESPHSRLWHMEDINEALKSNMVGIEATQVIKLIDNREISKFSEAHWHPEVFSKRFNLRLLIGVSGMQSSLFFDLLKCFFSATKVVYWPYCPLETLPLVCPLDKLVAINMPRNDITHLWHGVQFLGELKLIDMSYCSRLIETPDFSGVPNLETLDLEHCESLMKIHPSLGKLRKLVRVKLRSCPRLIILPRKFETNYLKELILGFCYKVTRLPEFGENMKNLSLLDLQSTTIKELPESIGFSTSLTELDLRRCGIDDVSDLRQIGCISSLVVLKLTGNYFSEPLAGWFSNLLHLRYLLVASCQLQSLAELPPCIIRLDVGGIKESLGDKQMLNLFSSLDHQGRCGTKYLGTRLTEIESEGHPCADFVAFFCDRGTIPSWFPNCLNPRSNIVTVQVDILQCCRDSEWSGIAVCLAIDFYDFKEYVSWTSYAPKGCKNVHKGWGHRFPGLRNRCLMLLHFNDETCWQHLRGDNNQLVIEIRLKKSIITECGWRVLCKEDMGEWCSKANESNWLNKLSVAEDGPSEIWLSDYIVDEVLTFDTL